MTCVALKLLLFPTKTEKKCYADNLCYLFSGGCLVMVPTGFDFQHGDPDPTLKLNLIVMFVRSSTTESDQNILYPSIT